jgi:putative transposase
MDGRSRALDNVFIERLWRSLKYELIYPGDFLSGADLIPALENYFHFYNHQRPHQALGYRTPTDLVQKEQIIAMMGALPPQAD